MAPGLLPPRLLADKSRVRHLFRSPHPNLSSSISPFLSFFSTPHCIARSIWTDVGPLHQGAQREQTYRWLKLPFPIFSNIFPSQELDMTSGGVWRWANCTGRDWSASLKWAGEQGGGRQVQHRAVGRRGGRHHSRPCQLLPALVPAGGVWKHLSFVIYLPGVLLCTQGALPGEKMRVPLNNHCLYFPGPRQVDVILWHWRPFRQKPIWSPGQNHSTAFHKSSSSTILSRWCARPWFHQWMKQLATSLKH